jgi:mannose-6-phosphate isomerase-like protein (cupin superfamily)
MQQTSPSFPPKFPSPGGCHFGISEIPPGASRELHDYVRENLPAHADPDNPGFHRSATLDFEYVIEGTLTLELDDGVEVDLGPGDALIQNGTRHRWSNRGDTPVRYIAVTVGAHNGLHGGRPAGG